MQEPRPAKLGGDFDWRWFDKDKVVDHIAELRRQSEQSLRCVLDHVLNGTLGASLQRGFGDVLDGMLSGTLGGCLGRKRVTVVRFLQRKLAKEPKCPYQNDELPTHSCLNSCRLTKACGRCDFLRQTKS